MNSTVSFVTLGCKTNQFESAAMSEQLTQAGYDLVDFEDGAQLVIVNTCTVTSATDSQSRNLIRRARRLNPTADIVVTGCYAQVDPGALSSLPGVSLVIGNQEKKDLLEYLISGLKEQRTIVSDISKQKAMEPLHLTAFEHRSRAFVQIQNGCNAFCSYCIIPYARGRSRSVTVRDVVSQVEELSLQGYPEVVLTGIHIGCYGLDLTPSTNLLGLLQQIKTSKFSGRLRLGSIEPNELTPELLDYIADQNWICPHFHIPLQAGDDLILRRMNRHYDTAFFSVLIERIHNKVPDAAIGLDVITGFPGESEVQFDNTFKLLERTRFSHLHVFPYSRRSGTPAAEMKEQVNGRIIKERAAKLRQLGAEKHADFLSRFVNKKLTIIIEGGEKDGWRKGLSANYLPVMVPGSKVESGETYDVTVTELADETLIASW